MWQIDASPHFRVTALRSMPQVAADQMFVAMPNFGAASRRGQDGTCGSVGNRPHFGRSNVHREIL